MGTDMGSIQNAYQGFSKQNYTMLDNLKLGYGGTKSEMERLLVDAGKIAGVKFDISSYADVVEAIHVMQESMGIAGTTALEAEETIQGSTKAMGAAWHNLIVGLGRDDANMKNLTDNLVDSFKTVVKNIVPILKNLTNALPAAFDAILTAFSDLMPTLLDTVTTLFRQVLDTVLKLLPQLIPVAVEALMTIVDALIDNLPLIINGALILVMALASGLIDALPELIPAIVETVITIVETLIDNIDMLVDAAIAIIVALAEGLINALPRLIEKVPAIVISLVNALVENAPKLLVAAAALIQQLIVGLSNGFIEVLNKVGGWIDSSIIQPIKNKFNDFVNIGKDIVRGMWDGIKSMASWIKNKVSGFVGGIVDNVKGVLGIHSPSTVFAGIGGNMAQGIGVGFADQMRSVARNIQDAIPTVSGNYSISGNASGGSGNGKMGVSQVVNIYSPTPLSPSQIARESKNAMRRLNWA